METNEERPIKNYVFAWEEELAAGITDHYWTESTLPDLTDEEIEQAITGPYTLEILPDGNDGFAKCRVWVVYE